MPTNDPRRAKALAILREGRLVVPAAVALVYGHRGTYTVRALPDGRYSCSCLEGEGRPVLAREACSHARAFAAVTAAQDTIYGGCPECLGERHDRCLRFYGHAGAPRSCRCWCRRRQHAQAAAKAATA